MTSFRSHALPQGELKHCGIDVDALIHCLEHDVISRAGRAAAARLAASFSPRIITRLDQ